MELDDPLELQLDDYDLHAEQEDINRQPSNEEEPSAITQIDENIGVEDLGVDTITTASKTKKTQPKLSGNILLHHKHGYDSLYKSLKSIKYKGRGFERHYLKKYVMTYQMWANKLWPKANFQDFIGLEKSASKETDVRKYKQAFMNSEKQNGPDHDHHHGAHADAADDEEDNDHDKQSTPDGASDDSTTNTHPHLHHNSSNDSVPNNRTDSLANHANNDSGFDGIPDEDDIEQLQRQQEEAMDMYRDMDL